MLQSLSVFIAVAEEENFTAAAKKMRLTQPTISFHMDNLEKELGCTLFNRTSKGVTLTPYGHKLYESARIVDSIMKKTCGEVRRMAEGQAGHIYIGASTIPGEYILPRLISLFLSERKDIRFTLSTGNSGQVLDSFQEGAFALAVVGMRPEKLEATPLWEDELILVGHPDLKLTFGNPVSSDLARLPLVLRTEPSGSRKSVLDGLKKIGLDIDMLTLVMEVSGNQAMKSAIINRVGVGFISKWAVQEEIAAGKLSALNISGLHITRTFYLISNPLLSTTVVEQFADYLINMQVK